MKKFLPIKDLVAGDTIFYGNRWVTIVEVIVKGSSSYLRIESRDGYRRAIEQVFHNESGTPYLVDLLASDPRGDKPEA